MLVLLTVQGAGDGRILGIGGLQPASKSGTTASSSVRDPALKYKVESSTGRHVALTFGLHMHTWVPTKCVCQCVQHVMM